MVVEVHGHVHRQAEEAAPQLGSPAVQKLQHKLSHSMIVEGEVGSTAQLSRQHKEVRMLAQESRRPVCSNMSGISRSTPKHNKVLGPAGICVL